MSEGFEGQGGDFSPALKLAEAAALLDHLGQIGSEIGAILSVAKNAADPNEVQSLIAATRRLVDIINGLCEQHYDDLVACAQRLVEDGDEGGRDA